MEKNRFFLYLKLLRVNQWIKNGVIFTAIIFSGKLFDDALFLKTLASFFIFCLLSSTSYVLNDIIDYPYDKKHPLKKMRPIASGKISLPQATFLVFNLTLVSLIAALFFSLSFFFLSFLFLLLHFFYSFTLKKKPVIDIFTISFSFVIRAFAGEVATGYHIPVWLFLTIFFGSLFMASVKRNAELSSFGKEARETLYRYNEHFLDFLTYTFGTATIISYATYTYVEKLPPFEGFFHRLVISIYPEFEARKWMMITIPLVAYGVARYAQLLYEKYEGERPEKLITTDLPLIFTIGLWGAMVIGLIYFL
jgi:4-hydroxybenzoate polyprenyltransferase